MAPRTASAAASRRRTAEKKEALEKVVKRRESSGQQKSPIERNKARRFGLYLDSNGEYLCDPVDARKNVSEEMVTERDVQRGSKLDDEEVRGLVMKMVRYLLFRGSKKLPIVRGKLNDAVMGSYKNTKILNFILGEAQKVLSGTWGYDLVPAPRKNAREAYSGQLADSWYLVVKRSLRNVDHAEVLAMDIDDRELRERGFLMVVFSSIVASGGSLEENELYRHLNRVDDNIDDVVAKRKGKKVPGLGANVADLLEKFTKEQQYLVKSIGQQDGNAYYELGPRALVEVGRYQIIQFQADTLGENVDPSIIRELESHAHQDDEDEDDDQPEKDQRSSGIKAPRQ